MTEAELRAENARLQERLQTMQLQHEILNMIRDMRQDIREMARSLNVGQAEQVTGNLLFPQATNSGAAGGRAGAIPADAGAGAGGSQGGRAR